MSTTGKKWLVGCGIGCGLFLLIIGGLGAFSYFAVRDVIHNAKDIDARQAAVDSTFGEPTDFTPAACGFIKPERVETFLNIREQMTATRQLTGDLLLTLQGGGQVGIIDKVKAGIKFVPAIMSFMNERNQVMMATGMGAGEYQYIYALAYYGLLAKSPADGPKFSFVNDSTGEKNHGFHLQTSFAKKDSLSTYRKRRRMIRRFINQTQRVVLTNQLKALEADTNMVRTMEGWRDSLKAEVGAMSDNSRRLPWEDGLPDRIRSGLAPYADRLDQFYDPMTSGLEMGLTNGD